MPQEHTSPERPERRAEELIATAFGSSAPPFSLETLTARVWRLRMARGSDNESLILKSSRWSRVRRNEAVSSRWLPVAGLEGLAPRLLATTARGQEPVWALYEDVGVDHASIRREVEVTAVFEMIGRVHAAFLEMVMIT